MISKDDIGSLDLEDVEDYATDYPSHAPSSFSPQNQSMDAESNINIHDVDASAVEKPNYRRNRMVQLIRENKWVFGLLFLMMIILIVIIGIAAGSKNPRKQSPGPATDNGSQQQQTHQPPITIDPTTLDPEVTEALLESLYSLYDRHGLDKSVLGSAAGDTPQNKAFYWLATDVNLSSLDHTQKSQRYGLAVFYYATNAVATSYTASPKPWVSAHLWLSKAHACEWKGIECNGSQHVIGISLERNNLTGGLPLEMAILGEKLNYLDLTSNLIHMEDDEFDAFKDLVSLQTLLMDDNYLAYNKGLPYQFQNMVQLEKLRLSYNLFSGVLEADHQVLEAMTKLTHLEIESNFLSGTMPDIIGEMSNLVYMYMRRNELSFNLDFLSTGKLTNLFALWLDNNHVTGTLPTELGLLTSLASLSITNTTLTGTIPTEMGNLEGLRRLWLYENQLTGMIPDELDALDQLQVLELHHNQLEGAMPSGICAVVENCDYEYKSLTSDCQSKVDCDSPDCCTECY